VIQYSLVCENEHKFDAWFASSKSYEEQKNIGIVTCPICTSGDVQKALMTPMVAIASENKPIQEKVMVSVGHPEQKQLRAAIKNLRDKVTKEADYVGDKFAAVARQIHDKEIDARGIYGEATSEEVASLEKEGIDVLALPTLPEEHN